MNPQIASLIRGLLKIVGTLLIAHGAKNVGGALMTDQVVEMIVGAVTTLVGLYLSDKKAKEIPVVVVPTGNITDQGHTEFIVKQANAVVTKADPTPKNIVDLKPETIQTAPTA